MLNVCENRRAMKVQPSSLYQLFTLVNSRFTLLDLPWLDANVVLTPTADAHHAGHQGGFVVKTPRVWGQNTVVTSQVCLVTMIIRTKIQRAVSQCYNIRAFELEAVFVGNNSLMRTVTTIQKNNNRQWACLNTTQLSLLVLKKNRRQRQVRHKSQTYFTLVKAIRWIATKDMRNTVIQNSTTEYSGWVMLRASSLAKVAS